MRALLGRMAKKSTQRGFRLFRIAHSENTNAEPFQPTEVFAINSTYRFLKKRRDQILFLRPSLLSVVDQRRFAEGAALPARGASMLRCEVGGKSYPTTVEPLCGFLKGSAFSIFSITPHHPGRA
jgi:hypothetical protein